MKTFFSFLKKTKNSNDAPSPLKIKKPRLLGVLLCYNDGDILETQIEYLLSQNHDIIAWDHGSNDQTPEILDRYSHHLIQRKFLPREFDFYSLYPEMSANLIENFIQKYDFISWPDQDEFLEGPRRDQSYYEYICEVYNSPYTFIQFENYVYWYSPTDNQKDEDIRNRLTHYSIFPSCSPRIRAWKSSVTNSRWFNHNHLDGEQYPELFRLRHYPFRSKEHMMRRLEKDRADLERSGLNGHYNAMIRNIENISRITDDMFFIDDGYKDLNPTEKFNWDIVYRNTVPAGAPASTFIINK